MASFQAKIIWKTLRKRENKNYCFVSFRHVRENSKNSKKKSINLKNNIMASFQATISWKRLRKRVNKNHRSVPFQPDA